MPNLLCVSNEWNLGLGEVRELADAGFSLLSAANGYDAIKQFSSSSVDAVVVSRRLPDISVDDLTRYFRLHKQELPIVMISNEMPASDAPRSVDAVIQKHHCGTLLLPTLHVLLSRTLEHAAADKGAGVFGEAA